MIRASAEDLVLSIDGAERSYAKSRLSQVYAIARRKPGKAVAIGTGVGAGIGAAFGGWAYSQGDFDFGVISGAAMVGAGIGALFGWLAGRGTKDMLIYATYPPPAVP